MPSGSGSPLTIIRVLLSRSGGVAPKVISEALGHSSVAFTMDVYSHILPDVQKEAMTLLDEVLSADVNGVGKV
jgi:integrase